MIALTLTASHVYLIVAVVLFAVAAVYAGWQREAVSAALAVGLGAVALALLVG